MAYTVACIGVLLMLKQVPTGAASLQWMVIAALGFTIYGPQVRCVSQMSYVWCVHTCHHDDAEISCVS
jgi:sugar phosphate permease